MAMFTAPSDLPIYDEPVTPLLFKIQEQRYRNYPTFQRNCRWKLNRRQLLIDSILRNYPIGSMLAVRSGAQLEIFDGKQRLETLYAFMADEFATASMLPERLKPVAPKRRYSELPAEERATFDNYRIRMMVWRREDLGDHASLVFRRLNDGGIPLTRAEILYSHDSEANVRAEELSQHPWLVAHTSDRQRNERVDHLYALIAMMLHRPVLTNVQGDAIATYARGDRTPRGFPTDDVVAHYAAAGRTFDALKPAAREKHIARIPELVVAVQASQRIRGWRMRVPCDLWAWIERAMITYDLSLITESTSTKKGYRPSSELQQVWAQQRFWKDQEASLLEFVTKPEGDTP